MRDREDGHASQDLERRAGPHSRAVADLAYTLGEAYDEENNTRRAEAMYQKALGIRREVFGVNHVATAEVQHRLGILLHRMNRHDEGDAMVNSYSLVVVVANIELLCWRRLGPR